MTEGQGTKTEISEKNCMGETEILCRLLEMWPSLLPHEQAALGALLSKSTTWDIATIFAHVAKNPLGDKCIPLCQAILNMACKRIKQEDDAKASKKADKPKTKAKVDKRLDKDYKKDQRHKKGDKKLGFDSKNPHLLKPRVILINPFRNEE